MDGRPRRQVGPELPDRGVERRARHLAGPVELRHLERPDVPAYEVEEVAVLDHHPLRGPRRPRGVDNVSEVPGVDTGREDVRRLVLERIVVENHGRGARAGEARDRAAPADDDGCSRVRHHEGESLLRVGRVEREIGAAGLDDPHVPLADREHVRSDTQRAKVVGHARGTAIELPVRHRDVGRGQGERARVRSRPRRDELVHKRLGATSVDLGLEGLHRSESGPLEVGVLALRVAKLGHLCQPLRPIDADRPHSTVSTSRNRRATISSIWPTCGSSSRDP